MVLKNIGLNMENRQHSLTINFMQTIVLGVEVGTEDIEVVAHVL